LSGQNLRLRPGLAAAREFRAVSAHMLKLINKRKHHFIKNAFYGEVKPHSQSTNRDKMMKKVVSARVAARPCCTKPTVV